MKTTRALEVYGNYFEPGALSEETGLRLTVFVAIAEEACDSWLVDELLVIKDKLNNLKRERYLDG